MKLLIVPSWYPNKFNKAKGSFFKEQAEALAKFGINVNVFAITTVSIKDIIKHPIKSKLFQIVYSNDNGVNTYRINICSLGLNKINCYDLLYLAVFRIYYKIIFKLIGSIDIVHAHSFQYAGLACCKYINNIPIVITEHISSIIMNQLTNKDIKQLKIAVNNSNKFVCVSNNLKNKVQEITKTKKEISVIPNIVSDIFNYKEKEIDNENFVFVSASNLIPLKRINILIKAFGNAFKAYNNVLLKIAGKGIEESNIRLLIHNLKLENRVILLGELDREEMLNFYHEADSFVMVSAYETFGLVYAESLMCGLPTIGTRNGGANDILDCYGGYLCKVDDIEDISKKMLSVYNSYSCINKKKIHEETYSRFSEDAIAQKIINIYKDLINKYKKINDM